MKRKGVERCDRPPHHFSIVAQPRRHHLDCVLAPINCRVDSKLKLSKIHATTTPVFWT
jgi:hypothetical protein